MSEGLQSADVTNMNEAVNFELQAIYVAIPKTGSTSIRKQISPPIPYWLPRSHLDIVQIQLSLKVYLVMGAMRRNRQFPSINVATHSQVMDQADRVFSSFFKFSSVRNPWARAVSLYSRNEAIISKNTMSFEHFCEQHRFASDTCLSPTLHRNQLDWLTDESDQIAVDHIFKIEEMAQEIPRIEAMSNGRIKLEAISRNQNLSRKSMDYKDMYNDHTKNLIARNFEKDIDTFKYTFHF